MKNRNPYLELYIVNFIEAMAERRYGNVKLKDISEILDYCPQHLNMIYKEHSGITVGQKIKLEREKFKNLGRRKKKRIIKQQEKIFKNVKILYRNF